MGANQPPITNGGDFGTGGSGIVYGQTGGSTAVDPNVPMVNAGQGAIGFGPYANVPKQALGADGITKTFNSAPILVPASQLEGQIQQWGMSMKPSDQAKYKAVVAQMQQANLVTKKGTPALSSVVSAWGTVLLGASYNTSYTPLEYLGVLAQKGAESITGAQPEAPGAYKGPTSQTTVTNKFDAKSLVDNALNQYLGRNATEKELANFKAMLNQSEYGNPNVGTPVGHDAVYTGGIGREQVAEEYAKSRGDYAETTANTTLMGWFEEAIRGGSNERII